MIKNNRYYQSANYAKAALLTLYLASFGCGRSISIPGGKEVSLDELNIANVPSWVTSSTPIFALDLTNNGSIDSLVFDRNGNLRIEKGEIYAIYEPSNPHAVLHPDEIDILRLGINEYKRNYAERKIP